MGMKEELQKAQKNLYEIKQENFASMILHDYKLANKRMFIICLILIVSLIISIGYIIYLLNDTMTIVEYEQEVTDFNSIQNSNIKNGD